MKAINLKKAELRKETEFWYDRWCGVGPWATFLAPRINPPKEENDSTKFSELSLKSFIRSNVDRGEVGNAFDFFFFSLCSLHSLIF